MTDWRGALNLIEEIITGRPIAQKEVVMNDISTSPAVVPEAALLPNRWIPDFLQPLEKQLSSTNYDNVAPVCEWLGVPRPEEMPTPGQARTWGKDEWSDWAGAKGFAPDGEATHSWMWRHPLVNTLVISVAKTPSDFRTPLAMATETRRRIRAFATSANAIVRNIIKRGINDELDKVWIELGEDGFKKRLISIAQNPSEKNYEVICNMHQIGMDTGVLTKRVQDLANVLGRIHKDFGISPVKSIAAIQENGDKEAEKVWDRLKLSDPEAPVSLCFFDEARDYLENLREIERGDRDAKRAERDREEAERKARQEAAKKPKTSQQVLQEMIHQVDDSRLKAIRGCIGAAISTVDRLRAMEVSMSKSIDVPEIEDPSLMAKIMAQAAAIENAEKQLQDEERLVEEKDAKIAEMQAIIAAVDPERLKKLNEVEKQMHALASLVIDSVNTAKSANPFQMAEIFNSLVSEAKNFLPVDTK